MSRKSPLEGFVWRGAGGSCRKPARRRIRSEQIESSPLHENIKNTEHKGAQSPIHKAEQMRFPCGGATHDAPFVRGQSVYSPGCRSRV